MQPIGNKYLIKVEKLPNEETIDGIVVINNKTNQDIYYKGNIVAHGTCMNDVNIIPIGTNVYFNWRNKDDKIKVQIADQLYYICSPNVILAVIEEDIA